MLTLPITRPIRSGNPGFDPVTPDEAKIQCGLASSNDAHLESMKRLVKDAAECVEDDTGLAIATSTFTWKLTEWPCGDFIEIPLRPVASITSIAYIDTAGVSQTWSASNYTLDPSTIQPSIRLNYASYWPSLRGDINGITITMVAGYATPLLVPNSLWLLMVLKLKAQFKDQMDEDSKASHEGYERQLKRFLRSTYP